MVAGEMSLFPPEGPGHGVDGIPRLQRDILQGHSLFAAHHEHPFTVNIQWENK